ncbi:unnamed protein product [Urochloa humidicola]
MIQEEEPVMASSKSELDLELEAAEQLIQLSGGADDDGGSESRSADSVECPGKKKGKEAAAVESRRRSVGVAAAAGKDDGAGAGAGAEPDSSKKGAESSACSTAAGVEEEKDKQVSAVESPRRRAAGRKDRDGGIVHGEERKRPKYRSLAAIYKETEKKRMTPSEAGRGEGRVDRDPSEDERKKKKRTKVIPVVDDWYLHMQVN